MIFRLAADTILVVHTLFVAFVILGLLAVLAGGARHWHWVRNFWFRLGHLAAIGIVALQSWLGILCPLTSWEMALRSRAGETTYTETFVSHWLQNLLFYQAPEWVFITAYTAFAALVLASWVIVPPERRKTPAR